MAVHVDVHLCGFGIQVVMFKDLTHSIYKGIGKRLWCNVLELYKEYHTTKKRFSQVVHILELFMIHIV